MSRTARVNAARRAYLDVQNQARRLKGGMLVAAFGTRRSTVDADAIARNMASDPEIDTRCVVEIATIEDRDDGVESLPETATTAVIR